MNPLSSSSPVATVVVADCIDQWLLKLGQVVAWLFAILMLVILFQVTLRRGFSAGLIVLEELQWHLYAIGVFIGAVYAQAGDSHVRVDVFHSHFSGVWKRLVEVLGLVFLAIPFFVVILLHSMDFVYESWRVGEHSLAPAGLPYRWLIKGLIPFTASLMLLALFNRLYRESVLLWRECRCGN